MGLRIFIGKEAGYEDNPRIEDKAILFDSVTETAFGHLMRGTEDGAYDAYQVAQKFLDWCEQNKGIKDGDVRSLDHDEVCKMQDEFILGLQEAGVK